MISPETDAWPPNLEPSACPQCGRENCEGCQPPTAAEPERGRRPPMAIRACDVMTEAAPLEIVEGIAWRGSVSVLASESGAGKSFVLLDLGAAVSAGLSWHGRDVTQGSVVHISFEGDALGLRLRALREHRAARLDHVYIVRAANPLSPLQTRDGEQPSIGEIDLAAAVDQLVAGLAADGRPPLVLIVIDTVRASMTGSEDGSDATAAYLRAVRRIGQHAPDAALILAHHAGWQDGDAARKRERGSSAWRGNADCTLYLEAGPYDATTESAPLTLSTKKVRDGALWLPLHCIRQRVQFADCDRHGKPRTSCVIDADPRSQADRAAEQAATTAAEHRSVDRTVLRAMHEHLDATNIQRLRSYAGLSLPVVNAAVARILAAGWAQPGARRQPFTVTAAGLAALDAEGGN